MSKKDKLSSVMVIRIHPDKKKQFEKKVKSEQSDMSKKVIHFIDKYIGK